RRVRAHPSRRHLALARDPAGMDGRGSQVGARRVPGARARAMLAAARRRALLDRGRPSAVRALAPARDRCVCALRGAQASARRRRPVLAGFPRAVVALTCTIGRMPRAIVLVAVALIVATTGCGGGDPPQQAPKASASVQGPVQGVPDWVPIYPGAKVSGAETR